MSTRMVRPSNLIRSAPESSREPCGLVKHASKGHLLDVVHVLHGIVGLGLLRETHETETTAAAGVAVLNDDLVQVSLVLTSGDSGELLGLDH